LQLRDWNITRVIPCTCPQSVQIWSESVSKEGSSALGAETVFRPYRASHSRVLTQTPHVALTVHVPQTLQVWSKTFSNEGGLILQAGTVFCPYLTSHSRAVTETSHFLSMRLNRCKFGRNRCVMKGNFTLEAEICFLPVSHLALQIGHWKITRGTPYVCVTIIANLVEIGQ
jgi:hypothetical protein